MYFHAINVAKICFKFTVDLQILKNAKVNLTSEKVGHRCSTTLSGYTELLAAFLLFFAI